MHATSANVQNNHDPPAAMVFAEGGGPVTSKRRGETCIQRVSFTGQVGFMHGQRAAKVFIRCTHPSNGRATGMAVSVGSSSMHHRPLPC